MKTLNDHIILYDSECPLCDVYTAGFVKSGMLGKGGRQPFCDSTKVIDAFAVNRARACDEIAVVNLKTGNVQYGAEGLMNIIGNSFPLLKPLFNIRAFQFICRKLYAFVSYNRKVIIPRKNMDANGACVPSFNMFYRSIYLLFTWLITSYILVRYAAYLIPFIPPTNFYREFLICGGQLVFQAIIISIINKKKRFDYLGNMMTVSFAGGLLLIIGMMLAPLVNTSFFPVWFVIVVSLMFAEHIRRTKLLHLPWIMTFTWVLYRILVLALITA